MYLCLNLNLVTIIYVRINQGWPLCDRLLTTLQHRKDRAQKSILEMDPVTLIALFVSLIALVIALGQLLTSIFGTAEGFRRSNAQVVEPFSLTRDRVFHLTVLRYETRLSTPYFTFHYPDSDSSLLSTRKVPSTSFEDDWPPLRSSIYSRNRS